MGSIGRAASPAVTAAAAAVAFFARASFIDREGAAFPIFAIQGLDGGLGPFLGIHGGESEAAGPSGYFIHDDIDLIDRAVLGKHVPEVGFGDVKGEIPDV